MRTIQVLPSCLLLIVAACRSTAPTDPPLDAAAANAKAHERLPITAVVAEGRKRVEEFFSAKYPRTFEIRVLANRAAFDRFASERFGMPKTDCWMVGMGVASVLAVMDPAAWKTDACEHDPEDAEHVRGLVTHELVHVFHGQHCPKPEFDGMDELGWYIEGLATYASGQLTEQRRAPMRAVLRRGEGPRTLSEVHAGKLRYACSGSLVEFIDRRQGRAMLTRLMAVTTHADALSMLGVSEERLMRDWREFAAAP